MSNVVDLELALDREREKFTGPWASEADAVEELDRRPEASKLFRVYSEVEGYYLAARVHRQPKSARIDRILVPTKIARDLGWTMTIGIEAKAPGEKLGPALSQAIDYTYAAFDIGGTFVHPEMIFLWQLQQQKGAVESVMVQNGIGSLFSTKGDSLVFYSERSLLRVGGEGVRVQPHVAARKVGSR